MIKPLPTSYAWLAAVARPALVAEALAWHGFAPAGPPAEDAALAKLAADHGWAEILNPPPPPRRPEPSAEAIAAAEAVGRPAPEAAPDPVAAPLASVSALALAGLALDVGWTPAQIGHELADDPTRPRAWLRFGGPVGPICHRGLEHPAGEAPAPSLGDVLVYEAAGDPDHPDQDAQPDEVLLYLGEDDEMFHGLGFTAAGAMTIRRVSKVPYGQAHGRLLGIRRPPYAAHPASVRPYRLNVDGSRA